MKTKTILLCTLAILAISANVIAQNVPSYIPTNGLVGWWPFNGNANDESGNGNDGTVNGAVLTNDRFGNANKAYQFNYQNISITDFNVNYGSLSLSFWFNPSNVNNTMRLVTHSWDNNNLSSFSTHIDQQLLEYGYLGSVTRDNSNGQHHSWSPNIILSDEWQHYLLVASGTVNRLYLNGNLLDTTTTPNLKNSLNTLYFGGDNSYPFFGYLDDIAIWNRALTPQEITALYTASSTNNYATSNTTANVPGAISYQAVARDSQGAPLADANLQVQFTLIADSLSGTAEYVETNTLSTNSLGLFTTALGAGTPVSNTFGNINWSTGNKFLQVQIDTGNGWMDMGTQQLLSTPYSMHSATSGAIKNPGLPVFADNAAALAGGLVAGDMYRTASGDLKIVY
jgi:hypothetical protein